MSNRKRSHQSREERLSAERDELLAGIAPPPPKNKDPRAQIDEEWHTLNAEIGALESFIHGANRRADRARRDKWQNILPPPHRTDFPRDSASQRMSRWEQRHYFANRQRHGLMFFVLFIAVCAVLWWLLYGSAP